MYFSFSAYRRWFPRAISTSPKGCPLLLQWDHPISRAFGDSSDVSILRWEGLLGLKGKRSSGGGWWIHFWHNLFHWIPLWISFRSINKKFYQRTSEFMSDWQKHLECPSELSRLNFQNNSSHWMLKPFRVLVTPVSLAPRCWTSEKPWPFVSHGALSWVISHLFSFHWFRFELYRRMQPLMCNSAHI